MGQVVNTDAQFIAQRLAPLGFQVFYHTTVGDNVKRLTAVVHQAVERSDVVVFTGGLGPTDDDLTKETVASALGLTVELIPEEAERLRKLRHYTFGKAVYDIGRNDGSRIVTDHAGQVELSVKPENNHNVIPYLYGTDEE